MKDKVRYTVALDLGKYNHTATIFDLSTGSPRETMSIPVNRTSFVAFEQVLFKYSQDPSAIVVGCEATGHYGETLLRWLQAKGYGVVKLNPAQVVQFRRGLGRRAKTDALDADAMARQLSVTNWKKEQPINQTSRHLQRLTRLRLDFVEEQGRWINRVRALLNQICPELEPVLKDLTTQSSLRLLTAYPSRQHLANAPFAELTSLLRKSRHGIRGEAFARQIQELARQSVGLDDAWLVVELQIVLKQLTVVTENIQALENEIARLTAQMLAEHSRLLGLATPLTLNDFPTRSPSALGTLLGEIGSLQRFESLKQLLSYFGWCPQTHESGTMSNPHPTLSPRGNRFVRRILWMMSIAAVRWMPEYRTYFQQRVAAGKSKMKTLVAVGRKLLSVIYAILRTGQPYDAQRYLHQAAKVLA